MSEMKNNWVKVRAYFCSTRRGQISKSEDTAVKASKRAHRETESRRASVSRPGSSVVFGYFQLCD